MVLVVEGSGKCERVIEETSEKSGEIIYGLSLVIILQFLIILVISKSYFGLKLELKKLQSIIGKHNQ